MDVFEAVIDEIALSGLNGCTTRELWHHLTNRKHPIRFPLTLDDQAKDYIWSLLYEALPDFVTLYVLKSAREFQEDMFPTYRLVSTSGVRGSCWDHDSREDVTTDVLNDSANNSLNHIITRYGEDHVVMVAVQGVRSRVLINPSLDPMPSINDVQYCILELVGMARHNGIRRTQVTNKYLKIDPRSTFHHVAVLQSTGALIVRANKEGYHLFLARYLSFANQLEAASIDAEEEVCNVLLNCPDHCLPIATVIEKIGLKRYKRVRNKLLKNGYIEVVGTTKTKCLKLIKPYKQARTPSPLNEEDMDLDDSFELQENDQTSFVVAERPLDVQCYQLLDSAGPSGMTLSQFHQCLPGLDYKSKRLILKYLSKQGCIVTILMDDDKVKKCRYISSRQANQNSDIKRLQCEGQKSSHPFKLAIRSFNTSVLEHAASASTSGASFTASTMAETSEMSTPVEDNCNTVDEEVEGILKNANHDTSTTSRPGSATSTPPIVESMDNKRRTVKGVSLKKMERINFILDYIKKERILLYRFVLFKKLTEFETKKGCSQMIDRKTIKNLLQSLVDEGMVNIRTVKLSSNAEHKIYCHSSVTDSELADAVSKLEEYYSSKKEDPEKKKLKEAAVAKENDEPVVMLPEALNDYENGAFVLIPVASRYQRLQHLHLFLWILQNGLSDDVATISSVTFPWISAVGKVDNFDETIKWNTIVTNMPLSLLIITVGVNQKRLPRIVYECIHRPENRNRLLRELPKSIQLYITAHRRHVARLYELLQFLEEMKLLVIHEPTGNTIKSNVEVELANACSVLDTSDIETRHSFFLEECRSTFNCLPYQFNSIKDIQAYWFKLRSVCLMTRIFKLRGDAGEMDDDEFALQPPVKSDKKRILRKEYNKLGFGAGGLVPMLYSHILYNWATMTFFRSEQELQNPSLEENSVVPGITYSFLPEAPQSNNSASSNKQMSFHSLLSGRIKRKLVTVDGDSATISAAKRVKRAASQVLHRKRRAKKEKGQRRHHRGLLVWNETEDNLLMRCHVALCILTAHNLPIPTALNIRTIVHDMTPLNRHKNAVEMQRQMRHLLSDTDVNDALKGCVNQLLSTIQEGSGPPLNFKSLLHYLIDNYSGHVPTLNTAISSPTSALPTIPLPITLQQLKESCEVDSSHKAGLLLPPVCSVADVRRSMLVDLIIAVMGAGSDCYNEYTAFRLFEEYVEQELEDAVALLRAALLVKYWKSVDGKAGKHLGPSASQSLVLHTNFYSRLESSFSSCLFENMSAHLAGMLSTESAPKEEGWFPNSAETAVKLNLLACCNHFCSSPVDGYLSNLVSCDVGLSTAYSLGKGVIPDAPAADDEDDEDEDDDDGESIKEENKFTARLPYYTRIPLPSNRNFCDLTFSHSSGIGTLLVDDSIGGDPVLSRLQQMFDDTECAMDTSEHDTERDTMHDVEHTLVSDVEHSLEHDREQPVVVGDTKHTLERDVEQTSGSINSCTTELGESDRELSIDEYLHICVEHLNFSEADVMFARKLYDAICQAGALGMTLPCLEQVYQVGITMTTFDHLQQLKNFDLVMEVGVSVVRIVAAKHKGVWLLSMDRQQTTSGSHRRLAKCRPWTSFHGQEFNTSMYQRMQDAVLFYIMDYPGITLHAIERHFNGVMQLHSLRDILQVLIISGCVLCRRMIRNQSCDLFSSNTTVVAPSGLSDDVPSNIYLEPVIGCELLQACDLQQSNSTMVPGNRFSDRVLL